MAPGLGHEAELTLGKIPGVACAELRRAAHILVVLFAGPDRRQRIEMDGFGVVPAEIFLVDRFDVMPDVAVIAARMPRTVEARRQFYRFRDFGGREAMVHQADGLVMGEFVEITLLPDHGVDALATPDRPVVL